MSKCWWLRQAGTRPQGALVGFQARKLDMILGTVAVLSTFESYTQMHTLCLRGGQRPGLSQGVLQTSLASGLFRVLADQLGTGPGYCENALRWAAVRMH